MSLGHGRTECPRRVDQTIMSVFKSIFGFVLGVILIGVALASVPGIVGVSASEDTVTGSCPVTEVALDKGYGISRVELRHVCGRDE
jgi:hypothetical protein